MYIGSHISFGINAGHAREEDLSVTMEDGVEIAHESINVTFSRRLLDDVLIIVISEATGQLFVVHLGLIFSYSPSTGNFVGVGHFKFPIAAGPRDAALSRFVRE